MANRLQHAARFEQFRTVCEGLSNGDVRRTYYDAPGKIYSQYVLERVSRFSDNQILYDQEGQNELQFVVKDSPGTHGAETPWQTKCHD